MDAGIMLLDGTVSITTTDVGGDDIFVGEGPFAGLLQAQVYIPGTVAAGTNTVLIQVTDVVGGTHHTIYAFDVPDQTTPHSYFLELPRWENHHYMRVYFEDVVGSPGAAWGYVQVGLTIGGVEDVT
jgi:hypothetical protein